MEDSHLLNTIKKVCKRMSDCRLQLDNKFDFEGSNLLSIVNPNYSQQRVKEEISHTIKRDDKYIQPYIVEACLRGLEVTEYLQNAYGRKSVIPNLTNLLMGKNHSKEVWYEDEGVDDSVYDDNFDPYIVTNSDPDLMICNDDSDY